MGHSVIKLVVMSEETKEETTLKKFNNLVYQFYIVEM